VVIRFLIYNRSALELPDVIPTDCVAAALKAALPNATHLALGFGSRSGFSPGTAKTSVEGVAQGGKVRQDGRIISVPLAYNTRRIDFGAGEKLAMTIPWGDVSTAYATTGIPNIEVYIPGSPAMVARAGHAQRFKWLLGMGVVQNFMKWRIEKTVKGPSAAKRDTQPTFIWGEVTNARGDKRHRSDQDGQRLQPDSERRAGSCGAFADP
jgi:short subunit dehydrogenase-like uncharacterized protein